MLCTFKSKIKFSHPFRKILCASCAYNDTFVFVRMDEPGNKHSIVHLDAEGKTLFVKTYHGIIHFDDKLGMLSSKEVIVLNVLKKKIDIINLETHHTLQVNNHYTMWDTSQIQLVTFPDTKYFTIVERGGLRNNRFILTYYDYQGIKEDSQPIARWQSERGQWTFDHTHCKINNHSKIAIWRKYEYTKGHTKELIFTYFDLSQHPKKELKTVRAKIDIGLQHGVTDICLKVSYLWETQPDVYMVVALSNKSHHNTTFKDKNGVINNNYILDATKGNEKATIRETKFAFGVQADGFCYNDQLTDCYGLGNGLSVFHTQRYKDGMVLSTPIYYVLNETIVATEKWKSSCYADNFFFQGWDGSVFVQAYHTQWDCQECTINVKKFDYQHPDVYMSLLLHIYEDFDDDLLFDAIRLLS